MKKIDVNISVIRFFAMLSIITCHIMQYYNNILAGYLNVGVQIFLIISGYLYCSRKIESISSFYINQAKKILIPYYVFLMLAYIAYLFIYPEYLNIKVVILSFFTIGSIDGLEHLWFVKYILLCYSFIPILSKLRINSPVLLIVVCVVIMVCIEFGSICFPLFNGAFVNCFILGFFLGRIEKVILQTKIINRLELCIIIVSIVVNIFRIFIFKDYIYIEGVYFTELVCRYSHLLLGAAIFIIMRKLILVKNYNRLLRFSDTVSYHIYLVHQFFILTPFSVLTFTNLTILNILLVYVFSLVGGILLYNICKFRIRH